MQARNGFSLLEMLICVSLVLIFASFAVPRFSSATKTAQEAKVQADIRPSAMLPLSMKSTTASFRPVSTT